MENHPRTSSPTLAPTSPHKATLLYVLTVAVVLGLFAWALQWIQDEADQERHKAFSDQQYTQAVLIRQSLAGLTDSLTAQAESMANNVLPAYAAGAMDRQSLYAVFQTANSVFPDLKAMFFFDNDGGFVELSAVSHKDLAWAVRDAAEQWARSPGAFKGAPGSIHTPPLSISSEHQLMGLLGQVRHEGHIVGRMVMVLDLGGMLSHLAGGLHSMLKGEIYLLSDDGTVLYSRHHNQIGKSLVDEPVEEHRANQDTLLRLLGMPTGRHICDGSRITDDTDACEFMAWESVQLGPRRIIVTLLAHERDVFTLQTSLARQRLIMGGLLAVLLLTVTAIFSRQRSRQRIEGHNMLLATQLESTPDGVLVMDAESSPTLWNNRLFELWSMDPELPPKRATGHLLEQFGQRLKSPESFMERFRTLSAEAGPEMHAQPIRLKDGTILEVSSNSLVDEREHYRGRAWFFRDVTERNRAETQQKRNRELLQSILDNVHSLVYLRDAKSRYLMVNRRYELFFGWKPGSYVGKTPREVLPRDQASRIYLGDARILQTRRPVESEEILDFNGRRHVMLTREVPLFDESGNVSGIVGFATDITSRKQIEERLRSAVEEFETIFQNTLVGTVLLKSGRRIAKVNTRFAEMFGYLPEDLVGRSTRLLHASEQDFAEFESKYTSKLGSQEIIKVEYPFRRADGSTIWCELSGKALDPARPKSGTLWIVDDITDRMKLEELREDLERILRHDLKSPLSAVIHVPQLLLDDANLDEDQRALLTELERSGHRMLEMINRSLDLYKMEQGVYRLAPVDLDLIGVILRVLREQNSLILAKSLELDIQVDGSAAGITSFLVSGEELLCHAIFANLLKNAVEASPEGGRITVSMTSGDPRTIDVHNAGAVPAAIREVFFEKFATANKRGGTGLGTYSAKLNAEAQGGSVSMHTGEASGTTVTVTLPAPKLDSAPVSTIDDTPPPAV